MLRTFVMKNVLTDYTSGMIVVVARNPEHAWEVLLDGLIKMGQDHIWDYLHKDVGTNLQDPGQWEELTEESPVAFVTGGG